MLSLFCPEGVSIFYLCQPLSCSSKRAIDKKKKSLQFTLPTILSGHNVPPPPKTHKFCTKTAALPLESHQLGAYSLVGMSNVVCAKECFNIRLIFDVLFIILRIVMNLT